MEKIRSELTRLKSLGFTWQDLVGEINKELASKGSTKAISRQSLWKIMATEQACGPHRDRRRAILAVAKRLK